MRGILFIAILLFVLKSGAQDTTIVQTLNFDSTERTYMVEFPTDTGQTYEKVLMEYRIRCKDGLVSTGSNTNLGCGEWDYSCNTYITDSSYTDSIIRKHPSHIISGFSGTTYNYSDQPTYTYYSYTQENMTNTGIVSETTSEIGTESLLINDPLSTDLKTFKCQHLFTETELTASGLVGGQDITGLKLDLTGLGSDANFLRIKIKNTTKIELSDSLDIDIDGFTEVYFLNTSFLTTGINNFDFYTPFNWDGVSNMIVEFSFTNSVNGISSTLNASDPEFNCSLKSVSEDSYLNLTGGNKYVELQNSIDFGSTQDFTVELWIKPGQSQNDPSIISDKNWGSGSNKGFVIFQNGTTWAVNIGDGSNREDVVGGIIFDGQWHHIAVSFDRDGLMTLYQDGIIVATKSLASDPIGDINSGQTIKIAQDGTGSYGIDWIGEIDEFRVWKSLLTQTEIQNWMNRTVNDSHPQYTYLESYLNFDEGLGNIANDASINSNNGIIVNEPQWKLFRGRERFKNFELNTIRPNIGLVQGVYSSSIISDIIVLDSIQNNPNIVYSYQVNGTDLEAVDTSSYFQSGYTYVYDDITNDVIDSVSNVIQNTINISTLTYYSKHPSKFEIISFVTPYGIGLDLGINGEMWQFDVSDFMPILKGTKQLSIEFDGKYQEDMDIRFKFISGTPPRDVIDIEQIWRAGFHRSYTSIINNDVLEPRDVILNPLASMYKIRTAITGHGAEGEFIPRTHFINIDGGANELSWQAWKECGDNPVYPQGGTWIYDRAGWCPGAPTDITELELTDVTPGQTIEIDYGVTAGSGDSRYLVSSQLVSYGSANFILDAGIVEIKRPSERIEFDRVNPICNNPTVVIRNTGSTNLTTLTINYQVSGGTVETFSWSGDLIFMENEEVILPIADESFWIGDSTNVFIVTISEPNGEIDEYTNNNIATSKFSLPDLYNSNFYIKLKTNNYANQNSYRVKDVNGDVVFSKSGLANNTYYNDTLSLADGCYTLEVDDTGDNGLYFWANSAQGSGYLKFIDVESSAIVKTFEPEFGKSIRYAFSIGDVSYINELKSDINFEVYPNPTIGVFNIDLELKNKSDIQIIIHDITGKVIDNRWMLDFNGGIMSFDLKNQSNGIYYCTIISNLKTKTKKVVLNN